MSEALQDTFAANLLSQICRRIAGKKDRKKETKYLLVASLLLVAMPFVTSSYLLLVAMPGATSSVLALNDVDNVESKKVQTSGMSSQMHALNLDTLHIL